MQLLSSTVKAFQLASGLATSLAYEIPENLTIRQANEQVNRCFAAMSMNCSPNLAHRIEQTRLNVTADMVERSADSDFEIPRDTVNSLIKRGICRVLFGPKCSLNELPTDGIKSMRAIDVVTRLFYFQSVTQINGWTCGWRVALAALKLNYLVTHRKEISNAALADFAKADFPPDVQRFIDAQAADSDDPEGLIVATIKGCMDYLAWLYIQPRFIEKGRLVESIKQEKYGAVTYDKAEESHLRDLAQELGLSNFYILGTNPVNGLPTFAITSEDSPVLHRAYDDLLKCYGNDDAFVSWVFSYLNEQEGILRNSFPVNSSQLEKLILENSPYCLLGHEALAPIQKLKVIIEYRRAQQSRNLTDCFVKKRLKEWIEQHYEPVRVQKYIEYEIHEKFRREHIDPNVPGVIHFALHLEDHWILVSVMKDGDKAPVMIMQDSINFSLSALKGAHPLIAFVHDKFVKPFMRE